MFGLFFLSFLPSVGSGEKTGGGGGDRGGDLGRDGAARRPPFNGTTPSISSPSVRRQASDLDRCFAFSAACAKAGEPGGRAGGRRDIIGLIDGSEVTFRIRLSGKLSG